MFELTTTRANHLVDPVVHVWAWQIPVYLFLGGLVAGMMIVQGWFLLDPRRRTRQSVTYALPILSLGLLSAGMGALFLDLEHKAYVWRLYTTFRPSSPMSWGAWILIGVYPVLLAAMALRMPHLVAPVLPALRRLGDRWNGDEAVVRRIAFACIGLGGALGIYTGILLSALSARPAWNSAVLGPLFLASGLSSAAALVHLLAADADERETLTRADARFVLGELVVLALYFIGLASAARAQAEAARLFFGGPFTAVFWVGVVGCGLVLPLTLHALTVTRRMHHTVVAPLLVLAGGLLLRVVIVQAGQISHWPRV